VAAAVVVAGVVAGLAGLLALARWRDTEEEPPQFVTDGRCPVCRHDIHDHFLKGRLSRVCKGCDVSGCTCTTSITRIPRPR
jgi:hypothetical protein